MINILLKINHSASENDNVTGGLIISIALLSLWIFAGHPFKKKMIQTRVSTEQSIKLK